MIKWAAPQNDRISQGRGDDLLPGSPEGLPWVLTVPPPLSVITPVFEGERFIESCLKSVIEQNCNRLEHYIIDGGSRDETARIVARYARKYPHIRWVSEKDRGQSDAMNKGIARARGRYIGFLNADDYYEPNVLNHVIDLLEELPEPGLLVGNCRVLDGRGQVIYVNRPQRLDVVSVLLGAQFAVNPSAYFYHRSLHNEIGAYDIADHYSMDLDFLLKAMRRAHSKYIDRVLGNFRLIEGTKTFQKMRDNSLKTNKERIFSNYYRTLPWPQRVYVGLGRGLRHSYFRCRYYAGRVPHYLRHPKELGKFFKPFRGHWT
ncbi:MAG: glycosyltransferase family 2 protein [Candidatus Omnitrophota bacterium]|nr:glycosyltransferase family 2 protein [Candidatus Omnitrophota bacterium]